jgi:uncharacterized NAD(P)/FAD-binding protein YdhS
LAVSRRGQAPRPHAVPDVVPFGDFSAAPGLTALKLLSQVRAALAVAEARGLGWQAVFDGLRHDAQAIWRALPGPERRRALRHLRPFWDAHRHRMPPQVSAVLARRIAGGTLEIRAATVVAGAQRDGEMLITLRPRGGGACMEERFDAAVVTTGPGKPETSEGPLGALSRAGWIRPDEHGQGLDCDALSQAIGAQGAACPSLLVAGPLARGQFGELMSVPEIAVQVEAMAARIARDI